MVKCKDCGGFKICQCNNIIEINSSATSPEELPNNQT